MYFRHIQAVLTVEECRALIEQGAAHGFEKAAISAYGEQQLNESIRSNDRAVWDDRKLARELEQKLQLALGVEFPYVIDSEEYASIGGHLRMYRYTPGQYFKTHKDGSFRVADTASQVTVLFYLNDADGGETVLMPYGLSQAWAHKIYVPKAGDVLLFEHRFWHEGRPVNSGEKLVLRADLFYRGAAPAAAG